MLKLKATRGVWHVVIGCLVVGYCLIDFLIGFFDYIKY